MKKFENVSIPTPCISEVQKWLDNWRSLEKYVAQERSLKKMFTNTPLNDNLDDVLVKAAVLNDFYSTQIRSIHKIAKHIVSLKIDDRLKAGDENLANEIARGHGITHWKYGTELYLYSFASKYCSHHKPADFPIYDSYVDYTLRYFKRCDNFCDFKNDDLKSYKCFKNILYKFRKFYNLEKFDLKRIDMYLWQVGKEYFPRYRKSGVKD